MFALQAVQATVVLLILLGNTILCWLDVVYKMRGVLPSLTAKNEPESTPNMDNI